LAVLIDNLIDTSYPTSKMKKFFHNQCSNTAAVLVALCLALWCFEMTVAQQTLGSLETLPAPQPDRALAAQPRLQAQSLQATPRPAGNAPLQVRVKDITRLDGVRTNKLTGFGLVAGLNGTGSKNPTTREFAQRMLENFGARADPDDRATVRLNGLDKTDNLSVVVVTAEVNVLEHKVGNTVDVTVSTYDDASNLQGGNLMLTPLYGVDGQVYAIATGAVSTGGFSFSGDAASVQQNHPTTGRVSGGATIEKAICDTPTRPVTEFRLNVNSPDLETANRIVQAINGRWPGHSRMHDAGAIDVLIPNANRANPNLFIANVQALMVTPDIEARVVINERTGTIIVGENVRLSRVGISHGNLSVITGESPQVAQPAPFSQGQTAIVPRTTIDVDQEVRPINIIEQPVTVGELARALNALGVTPRDLSSIFQNLKTSGALHAKLIFQ